MEKEKTGSHRHNRHSATQDLFPGSGATGDQGNRKEKERAIKGKEKEA